MLSVILPAYREEENLRKILPILRETLVFLDIGHEIIVVDTELPLDNTKIVCEENSVNYVSRVGGSTYGDAIRTGISKSSGKFVVIMDADSSHDPKDILVFYEQAKTGAELVIGSRYIKGGESANSKILKFMSWMVNFSYRVLFRLKIKDISNSFRLYTGDQLRILKLECDNFDIVEEILIKLVLEKEDLVIKEVPIYFSTREHGESKRNLYAFILSYVATMVKLLKMKYNYKKLP